MEIIAAQRCVHIRKPLVKFGPYLLGLQYNGRMMQGKLNHRLIAEGHINFLVQPGFVNGSRGVVMPPRSNKIIQCFAEQTDLLC
jgi:hypothetical protein